MEYCGLPEAARNGEHCPNAMAHGKVYILGFASGATMEHTGNNISSAEQRCG